MPTFRVICIGDSLVKGNDATFGSHRTFRGSLQTLLTSSNHLINFLGRVADAPASGGADPDHEGYTGALIGTALSGTNITAMAAANSAAEAVVVLVGWEDVIANTGSIGTVYGTMVTNIQAAWSGIACYLCTLPPYYNLTETATITAYPAYGTLNTAIRALAGTNKYIVDLAALGGSSTSERTAFVEAVISQSKRISDSHVNVTGGPISDPYGGTRYLDAAGVVWRMNNSFPPGTGAPGWAGADFATYSDINWLKNNFSQMYPWTHAWLAPGHTATNTGVEFRNAGAMILRTDGTWVELYAGGRISGAFWNNNQFNYPDPYATPPGCVFRQQPDGITTFWRAASNSGYSPESWPIDRSPPIGAPMYVGTYPGVNRSAFANMAAYAVFIQMRLALDNPSGPNDIANARYLVRAGGIDFQTVNSNGDRRGPDGQWVPRYDRDGFPLGVIDVGGGTNVYLTGSEWQTFGHISFQGNSKGGMKEPWYYNWTDSPAADSPYGMTEAQIRANPPPLPSRWTYTMGSSGFPTSDYAGTTYLLAQSGADRIAQRMFEVMLSSGELVGFTDTGGTTPQLAAGISTRPVYADLQTTGLYTYSDTESGAAPLGPTWITTALPAAMVGVAYTATLLAGAGATFTHISGKPSWMSVASGGALTGTPTAESDRTYSITFRATLNGQTVDQVVSMFLGNVPVVVTTTMPGAESGALYFTQLQATGTPPFGWTVTSGAASLAAIGLALSPGGTVSGTTITGTASFTVRATGFTGAYDEQALTITIGAVASKPAISKTSMASGTRDLAYTDTITATGGGTITRTIVSGSLPAGLNIAPTTGVVSGTPTQTGTFVFAVQPSSSSGTGDAVTLSITIYGPAAVATANPFARLLG